MLGLLSQLAVEAALSTAAAPPYETNKSTISKQAKPIDHPPSLQLFTVTDERNDPPDRALQNIVQTPMTRSLASFHVSVLLFCSVLPPRSQPQQHEQTTLTILQCFIADEEMFEGEDRYARNDLKEWLEAHGEKGGDGGGPRSNLTSPRSPKRGKKKGGGEEKEDGGYAVETGTA